MKEQGFLKTPLMVGAVGWGGKNLYLTFHFTKLSSHINWA